MTIIEEFFARQDEKRWAFRMKNKHLKDMEPDYARYMEYRTELYRRWLGLHSSQAFFWALLDAKNLRDRFQIES